jgi:preprotein translocase subunit SecG
MATFIIVLIVIIAFLLGIIVLAQAPKGGGLAMGFQSSAQVSGVQRTTDFLEKATWYLIAALFILCILSAAFFKSTTEEEGGSVPQQEQAEGAAEGTDGGDGAATPAE